MAPILGIWASSRPTVVPDLGSMFPLGVFTLSSAQATVEFTNIPQTYTHLQIRCLARSSVADTFTSIEIRYNGDTASNYNWHYLMGDGASATSGASAPDTLIRAINFASNNLSANIFGTYVMDILDYRNTNKFKTIRILGGTDANGSGALNLGSGAWRNSANAITSIRLQPSNSANFAVNSSFALYGVL